MIICRFRLNPLVLNTRSRYVDLESTEIPADYELSFNCIYILKDVNIGYVVEFIKGKFDTFHVMVQFQRIFSTLPWLFFSQSRIYHFGWNSAYGFRLEGLSVLYLTIFKVNRMEKFNITYSLFHTFFTIVIWNGFFSTNLLIMIIMEWQTWKYFCGFLLRENLIRFFTGRYYEINKKYEQLILCLREWKRHLFCKWRKTYIHSCICIGFSDM